MNCSVEFDDYHFYRTIPAAERKLSCVFSQEIFLEKWSNYSNCKCLFALPRSSVKLNDTNSWLIITVSSRKVYRFCYCVMGQNVRVPKTKKKVNFE
ncbi:hypothetical protein T08_13816 [Trichinella sp. T8]|nr:hypothetical protein T08_13816 [Trichinella sp. T8]